MLPRKTQVVHTHALPATDSRATHLGDALKDFFLISNGHNWGAIWSYRAVNPPPGIARTSSCSGEGFQGAWGLGRWEKVEKCFIFGPLFFELFKKNEKMMKSVKFARIELILKILTQGIEF